VGFAFPGAPPDASRALLRDLDLTLRPGELCVLLGHNGSGKSTLCRLLAGLFLPSTGSILAAGVDTAAPPVPGHEVVRVVQLVTHDPATQLVGETVTADLAFGLDRFGWTGADLEARLVAALAAFGITYLRDRPVARLSGGEQQLVRLAGALAVSPRYLVLDEAVAMLDARTRASALDALRNLCAEHHLGVLLATHDLDDLAWADRVCWLDGGRITLDAPMPEALELLAAHPDQPFDLPPLAAVGQRLRAAGWSRPAVTLDPHTFVGAVLASSY
jgi:energy-coupling factor transport system ATP-binding protein